jgi:biotin carboxyl carrier protein
MMDVESPVTGNVWRVDCAVGDAVNSGDTLLIVESMKMEIPVETDVDGVVTEILCQPGDAVVEGQIVVRVS